MSTGQGASVPPLRVPRCAGPPAAPGVSGVALGRRESRPARLLAFVAPAKNPRRLVHRHDDSAVGACACPYPARLDGMSSRRLRHRRCSPLCGLLVSRSRRGDACPSTLEGQACHLHGDAVVEARWLAAPSPPRSWRDGSVRKTDRTSTAWLGPARVWDVSLLPRDAIIKAFSDAPQMKCRPWPTTRTEISAQRLPTR